ncbi:hypothetical protein BaRGS_00027663 [Batillaria attramentaria]|uniref:Uncharacterized protein n=1 Tax=Batillaria attramentaria TaxID=370345 RepID=A0ABD0K2P8_9CAEN
MSPAYLADKSVSSYNCTDCSQCSVEDICNRTMKNLQQLLVLSLVVVGLLLSTSPCVVCGSSLVLARTERASTSRARHRPDRPTRRWGGGLLKVLILKCTPSVQMSYYAFVASKRLMSGGK